MNLTEQLATKEGCDEFIQKNMPLVSQRVRKFLNRYPHLGYLKDDIRSAGNLGLVAAVDSLRRGTNPKSVGAYLAAGIQREILRAVDREAAVYVPTRTKQMLRKNGKKLTHGPKELGLEGAVVTTSLKREPPVRQPQMFEFSDELYGACTNEREKEILRLKAAGYTDAEIGDLVGVHQTSVSRSLKEIEKRFYGEDN